jgi:hypothetical protein
MLKKKWHRPRLTVLVRSNPEEGILDGCKINWLGAEGPVGIYNYCHIETQDLQCVYCSSSSAS